MNFIRVIGEGFDADQVTLPCEECGLDEYSCECGLDDEPTCHRCEGPLSAIGWCPDCEENLLLDLVVIVDSDGTARLAA